ncbi:ATP-binding protein [Bizionia paragorgiae]|uniref:histidine kinase n=1 Tax=Bizionia paragorgiae TaxID=283786 RepID=A0A1H3Y7R9_BIZPA|nr:ATP-binding protein [Bizionia paragorgiae]SEA06898.1 His Kinase A (phospho-acceptor) domain-containing protein [Bizionia paragorgiae]
MQLTNTLEKEVLNSYNTWLYSYLNGDIVTYDSYFDDTYHFIGSTDNEEYLNKKETTNFFKATSDQLAGKCDLRNETKIIEKFNDLIFITHLFDGWFINGEDWSYYGRFRFSSVMKNKENEWKFIHQHFSTTDSKTSNGETIGFDKVNLENQELRDAIKRRTFELETKNRELEIEGALERIRAQAVAMKQPSDLLDIVVTMRNEFNKLGHEAHYFWHMMWLPEKYEKAMTSGDGSKIGFVMELPKHIHGDIPLLAKWEKSNEPTVVYAMDTEKAINYVDKMMQLGDFKNSDPQAPSHENIRDIGGLTFIMARTTHGEIGYSLPGIVKNPPVEDLNILILFAGAFDLAHRRFLDLQKAEHQAREVEIELALEKVRGRTMAMKHSDELQEASFLLDQQVRGLGIKTWGCAFNIYGENESTEWFGNEAGVLPTYTVPHKGIFKEYYQNGQEGKSLLIKVFNGEECLSHYEYMSSLPIIGDVLKNLKKTNTSFPTYQIDHVAYFKYGYLLFITREPVPDAYAVFKRFAKVFEQTYTRFLDLQKFEAQAREAQIEAALERVRSCAMSMHKSDDLTKAVDIVFSELKQLEFNTVRCGIGIFNDQSNYVNVWTTSSHNNKETSHLSGDEKLEGHPLLDGIYKAWQKQVDFSYTLKNKDLEKYYQVVASSNLPVTAPNDNNQLTTQYYHVVVFPAGGLFAFSDTEFTEDKKLLMKRFGEVFHLSFTRHLDLKQAEEQAREAQIEMALEKVRSRTMAMQSSSELSEAANNLFLQVQALGIPAWSAGYCIWEDKDKKNVWCNMSSEGEIQKGFSLPTIGEGYDFYNPHRDKKSFHVSELGGKKLVKHYDFMKTLPGIRDVLEDFKLKGIALPTFQIFHIIYFTHGYLMFITYEPVPKDWDVFKRFGKVFQQTYTRFLDLQKSEAQAREAQIETALEKVRSRTMAMQKGEEVKAVVVLLYKELIALGVTNFVTCGYVEINENTKKQETWVTNPGGDSLDLFFLPLTGDAHFDARYEAWKKQQTVFHQTVEGKERRKHLEYAITTFNSKEAEEMVLNQFPDPTVFYCFNFSHGYLHLVCNSNLTKKEENLLARFTKVFEQTYARFLDLNKSEAQARESQIQLSLERVRAKAMSMHNSEGIDDVLTVLCGQFDDIGILPMSTNMTVFDFENNSFIFRETGKYGDRSFGKQTIALDAMDNWTETVNQWKADNPFAVNKLHFAKEQLPEVWEVFHESFASMPENFKITPEDYPDGIYHTAGKHPFGYLGINQTRPATDEEERIVIKFANEFGRAYQRFIDLQKAEAQTKEAQIEASLEKVRNVALSLTKSEDMLDVAKALYEQLLDLGFTDMRNAIIDIHNDDETFLDYDYSHDMSSAITKFSFYGDPVIEQQIKKVESSNDAFFEIELKGKQIEELIETRLRNGEKDDPRLRNTQHLTYNLYSFGNGAIGISNFGILSDEQKSLLKRFRNVFTFAYQRYTEISNTEAQAREAKIEAALEKVRSVALSINESTELLHIAKALYEQLIELEFNNIRNVIIDVNNEDDKTFLDYDYSHEMGGSVTLMSYDDDPTLDEQVRVIAETTDGFSEMTLKGQQLQDLIDMRRKNGEAEDPRLLKTDSLSYLLYAFGNGAIGISNFGSLNKDEKSILDRFRNVFTFAYQRFKDLQVKEEQSAKLLSEKLRLEETLTDLQLTQKQLIQSEKMASLGELTAGIAHEIQNPLNFVNNFSEVSKELLEEMKEEIENGDMKEVKALMNDVIKNLEKINHHGKRADGIVKGMLQHSRASGNQKEPTNINALADEYFRLAYHGLRAKDKSFNAHLKTNYDESIKPVKVIPQEFGRVVLNLFTNAFYAVDEKSTGTEDKDYKPTVSVSTKNLKDKVTITVKDNGNGIPKHIIDKIFQPFFTTKPTGKGTGLGLSMSYDIIKAHDGELTVNTIEGESTEFTIHLPLTASTLSDR